MTERARSSARPADAPLVSIAIPAYNAERWIGEAVRSALDQSLPDIEVIVIDDDSSDGTLAVVRRLNDPRLRVFKNPANLGQSGNWNRAVSLCRAPFVKFLCADDLLREDCVEKMLAVFDRSADVGFVFSRREIAFSESDTEAREWRDAYASRHLRFGELGELNSGKMLFTTYLAANFEDNWIGEPTNVMMRRSLFKRIGGFNPRIRQPVDMDLWVRAMYRCVVGFVDEPLATYRAVLSGSVTEQNFLHDRLWLDRLWLIESLLADPLLGGSFPQLRRLAWWERLRAARRLAQAIGRRSAIRERLGETSSFVAYKLGRVAPGRELRSPPAVQVVP